MNLVGMSPQAIYDYCLELYPELPEVMARSSSLRNKRAIDEYQAAALYALVKAYVPDGGHILEIGTAIGYSASIMAQAAPTARIVTLNPKYDEAEQAKDNLKIWLRVNVQSMKSRDYLGEFGGEQEWNLIFVDGDHGRVVDDLPWFEHLKLGGLMLFHDYTPETGFRACPPVFHTVNAFCQALRQEPDVLVIDDRAEGMAGLVRGERVPAPLARDEYIWEVQYPEKVWVRA